MDLFVIDINHCLKEVASLQESSKLGFFSKPFCWTYQGQEVMVKRYHPIRKGAEEIIEEHNNYVLALKKTGISVPETRIEAVSKGRKKELVILQIAFPKESLLRTLFQQEENWEGLAHWMDRMYGETLKFWNNKPENQALGFHPTFRNFCFTTGQMHYFDTFPPMEMDQKKLNRRIIQMAPVPSWIKKFVPQVMINRVSNEYYDLNLMVLGILGSAIRLKPDFRDAFLSHAKNFFSKADMHSVEKNSLLAAIDQPPQLSWIWRTVRKLTGNVGKPNVKQ